MMVLLRLTPTCCSQALKTPNYFKERLTPNCCSQALKTSNSCLVRLIQTCCSRALKTSNYCLVRLTPTCCSRALMTSNYCLVRLTPTCCSRAQKTAPSNSGISELQIKQLLFSRFVSSSNIYNPLFNPFTIKDMAKAYVWYKHMSQGQERIKCFPSALFIFYILLLFKDTSSASKHSGPPSSAKKPILTFDTSQADMPELNTAALRTISMRLTFRHTHTNGRPVSGVSEKHGQSPHLSLPS